MDVLIVANRSVKATVLEADDLRSGYGQIEAVHGFSMSLETGEAKALLGPNGAGKTTVAETLAGLVRGTHGQIRLDSVEITRWSTAKRSRHGLALVTQSRDLFTNLTIEENLVIGSHASGRRSAWTIDNVYDLFPVLGTRRHITAGTLSGGQQQMLAISRALVSSPRVLILDEPSAGLAVVVVEDLLRVLQQIRSAGVALLLVEQNIHIAEAVCDEYILLLAGNVVEAAPIDRDALARVEQLYFGLDQAGPT